MNLTTIHDVLAWATVLNYSLLTIWFVAFVRHRRWIYDIHHRWFRLSGENFDGINYALFGFWKVGIFLFLMLPALAMRIAA